MARDVKHGCCSCTHYKLPASKAPCKDCERWSNWEEAKIGESIHSRENHR